MNYKDAPDAREIGARLIEKHHPHLSLVRIEFVFIDKTPSNS